MFVLKEAGNKEQEGRGAKRHAQRLHCGVVGKVGEGEYTAMFFICALNMVAGHMVTEQSGSVNKPLLCCFLPLI